MINKHFTLAIVCILAIVILVFGVTQFFTLQKAHSTFEDYYAFRGCVQLTAKTDDYGTCKLSSGQTIKIVKIEDKWYLEGDGPGKW